METESKQTNNRQNTSSATQHTTQNSGQNDQTSSQNTSPDMMTLLGQTPLPSAACGWLSCLRKSGMSLSYSLEKRHIPDMNKTRQDPTVDCTASKNNGGQGGGSNASDQSSGKTTGASDTMICSGTCAIRYFDLAVGVVLMLTVCGILKGCKCMRKWF